MAGPWLAARAGDPARVVRTERLAAASQLATPAGPVLASQLRPGAQVWGLTKAGQLTHIPVTACAPVEHPVTRTRVLTRVGEVIALPDSQIASASGPVPAGDLTPGPRVLELVSPGDIPRADGGTSPLDGLSGFVAVIPEESADREGLVRQLGRAGVQHELSSGGGWLAVKIRSVAQGQIDWSWEDELGLLLALTTWVADGDRSAYRTRLPDRALRARLVGAATACGRVFHLRWAPAYLPVEAHMVLDDAGPPPYAAVTALQTTTGEAVDVAFDGASAVVVDMAYLRLRHSGS